MLSKLIEVQKRFFVPTVNVLQLGGSADQNFAPQYFQTTETETIMESDPLHSEEFFQDEFPIFCSIVYSPDDEDEDEEESEYHEEMNYRILEEKKIRKQKLRDFLLITLDEYTQKIQTLEGVDLNNLIVRLEQIIDNFRFSRPFHILSVLNRNLPLIFELVEEIECKIGREKRCEELNLKKHDKDITTLEKSIRQRVLQNYPNLVDEVNTDPFRYASNEEFSRLQYLKGEKYRSVSRKEDLKEFLQFSEGIMEERFYGEVCRKLREEIGGVKALKTVRLLDNLHENRVKMLDDRRQFEAIEINPIVLFVVMAFLFALFCVSAIFKAIEDSWKNIVTEN